MIKENIPNIVIPTIRSEEFFEKFLDNWREEFRGCHIIVVEDREKKKLTRLLNQYEGIFTYDIYDWRDIDKDLGKDSWIIPRQTDCVRSYGYLKALQNKPLFIVTLDDDVKPIEGHIRTFANNLFYKKYQSREFFNTLINGKLPRGTYEDGLSGCDLVHGGWLGSPDLSAKEQTKESWKSKWLDFAKGLIPQGTYFSLCGMNIAWRPEITKYMYFGLQGNKYPIDRCGDIWCGYWLAKNKVRVYTGEPFCYHDRASNLWSNTVKEVNAEQMSYHFLRWTKEGMPEGVLHKKEFEYWTKLKEAYSIWEGLVNETNNSSGKV